MPDNEHGNVGPLDRLGIGEDADAAVAGLTHVLGAISVVGTGADAPDASRTALVAAQRHLQKVAFLHNSINDAFALAIPRIPPDSTATV